MAIRKQKPMFNRQFYLALGVLVVTLLMVQIVMKSGEQNRLVNGISLYGEVITPLPLGVANNGVAKATSGNKTYLLSFSGIKANKTHVDITSDAFMLELGSDKGWQSIGPVPGDKHRLASVAINIGDMVYLFGGYSVGADGTEKSTPESLTFNVSTKTWGQAAPIPTPVDDAVVVTHQGRYIYLISGWHDVDNVSLVQVFDTETNTWARATDYPGSPVFGHAGGIAGNKMIIADGVAVFHNPDEPKLYGATNEAYMGIINPDNHLDIHWRRIPPHPGGPLYRMAAVGVDELGKVIFAGGSDNPYNFNGLGYDGNPSKPSTSVFSYDVKKNKWNVEGNKPIATMDHRGLLEVDGKYYILGGMETDQLVSNQVSWFQLARK
jgi:N-acetylneuraminic acid mutarotase